MSLRSPTRRAVGLTAGSASLGALGYYALFAPTSQLFGAFPYRGSETEKIVALTFDDGPNEPWTSLLLDVLRERDVLATFFQVGACVERHPGLSAAISGAGHVVGNHSHRHRLSGYLAEPSLASEIRRTQAALHAELGALPALFRPPWLCHPPALLAQVRREGLQVVSGTFAHPLEVAQVAARRIARHAVSVVRPGTMLIFHDGFDARGGYRGQTVEAVRIVVDALADRGYRFTTVDRMLGVSPYQQELAAIS